MKSFIVFACFAFIIKVCDSARILAVFPVASISHQVVFRTLTQELARRGHEVVVITTDPEFPNGQSPQNITEIDVHDISYKTWNDHYIAATTKGNKNDVIDQLLSAINAINKLVDRQLEVPEVQKMIRDQNRKFDLLLLEACVKSALIYSHIYKDVPVIQVSSFGAALDNYDILGAPTHPILYPAVTRQRITNLSLWDKFTELYNHYYILMAVAKNEYNIDEMFKKHFGPDVTPVAQLVDNVQMLFLNVHPVFEGIRPVPPSVIYMGGLHQKPEKPLPTELKSYLDSSKNGVIYISFGTNVDTALLPAERIQKFVNVFSKLPFDVLWKWNENELPGRTENIRISKWLPQSDLLRHPKIKLFITQGGLQSTDEAITAGVPLLGVPMLADQWYNVEKYVQHGIGVQLDMETLDEENLETAIKTVIYDESYRRNIVRLRGLMHDQLQRPLERAVWWTEHVLRHGGAAHLRAPAANITWTQYLEIELVLTVLLTLLTLVILLVITLYYSCKKMKSLFGYIKTKQA